MQPGLLLDARAFLAEGPAWDARAGVLYWVDIHAGRLHVFHPQDGRDLFFDVGEALGCAAPAQGGRMILGRKSGFATLDLLTGELNSLQNPEAHLPGNRFNDGKCDPAGRFLAGTMDDAEKDVTGSLYSLAADGTLRTLLDGLRISNGLTWSPDYRTFYHIDTPARQVMAYDYDLQTGGIANPRPVVSVPPGLGWPDGMTSDSDGLLWIALWGGAKVSRWDPATGELVAEIPLPAPNVTACTFGGADLTDLYVTTARKGLDAAQLEKDPFSGGLFRLAAGVRGMPTFEFGG